MAEGADVLGALGVYMVQGLTLETLYDSGGGWWLRSVGDDNGVVAGSGLHNHLQSSGEHNTSRAHSRSTSSANPSPALLSQCSVVMILFSWGKGRWCGPRVAREGIGSLSHLRGRVDSGVSGGKRVSGGGVPLRSRRVGVSRSRWECPILWLLWNLLCHLVTAIVSLVLLLREREENHAENVGDMIPGESFQELVESSVHQQDKHSSSGNGQGRVEGLGNLYG